MTTYHAYFRGGTKHSSTQPYEAPEPQDGFHFDGVHLDANEWYFLTDETIDVGGVTHLIYDIKA